MHVFNPLAMIAVFSFVCGSAWGQSNSSPLEGVWFGGFSDGANNQIRFDLTALEGYGKLKITSRGWPNIGHSICEYRFEIADSRSGATYLNSVASTVDRCPERFGFGMARSGPDTLQITPDPDLVQLTGIPTAELRAGLRPFRSEDARPEVEGFDILGMTTGMAEDEIEPILKQNGFKAIDGPAVQKWSNRTMTNEIWGRDFDEAKKPQDMISIQWTSRKDWVEEPARAMAIGRAWAIPDSAAISLTTLETALEEKHGPGNFNQHRYYNRDGTLPPYGNTEKCAASGPQQAYPFRIVLPPARPGLKKFMDSTISPHCGVRIDIRLGGNRSTGRANLLEIVLVDPDIAWDEFWQVWSHENAVELEDGYHSISGATQAAPEL